MPSERIRFVVAENVEESDRAHERRRRRCRCRRRRRRHLRSPARLVLVTHLPFSDSTAQIRFLPPKHFRLRSRILTDAKVFSFDTYNLRWAITDIFFMSLHTPRPRRCKSSLRTYRLLSKLKFCQSKAHYQNWLRSMVYIYLYLPNVTHSNLIIS